MLHLTDKSSATFTWVSIGDNMAFDAVSLESIHRRIPMGTSDFHALAPVRAIRWAGLHVCLIELARPGAHLFHFSVNGSGLCENRNLDQL
jgi:hypothetical protein